MKRHEKVTSLCAGDLRVTSVSRPNRIGLECSLELVLSAGALDFAKRVPLTFLGDKIGRWTLSSQVDCDAIHLDGARRFP